MGYRHHISIMSKDTYEEIKDMDLHQLKTWFFGTEDYDIEDDYVPCYKVSKKIYELGKYCDLTFLKDVEKRIFSNDDVHSYFNNDDCEFFLIGREGFLLIIEDYRKKIAQMYKYHVDTLKDDFNGIERAINRIDTPNSNLEGLQDFF